MLGGQAAHHGGKVDGVGPRRVVAIRAPVGVPVSREVDRDERPAEQEGDPVPGVGVLGAAVDEDQLGRAAAPDQHAQAPAIRDVQRLAAHDWHAARR